MKYEFKGTPAPWINEGGDNASCEINIGETTASVCRFDKNTGLYVIERSEMEANAQLIQAAPDLLQALIHVYNTAKECHLLEQLGEEEFEYMSKAIEKALNITK